MPRRKHDPLMREQLERKLAAVRGALLTPPPQGWIRTLREALGMSLEQLAKRVGMTAPGLADIEKADRKGTISVATLNKVAEALGADLRLAIVPTRSLNDIVKSQARIAASRIVRNTQVHMAMEDQANSEDFLNQQIELIANELVRKGDRRIWDVNDKAR